jgi:hypothetical protein
MIGLFVGKHGETPRLRGAPCHRRGGGRAAGGDPEDESHLRQLLRLDGMQSSLLGRSPSLAAICASLQQSCLTPQTDRQIQTLDSR